MSGLGKNIKLTVDSSLQTELTEVMTDVLGSTTSSPMENLTVFQFDDGAMVGAYFVRDGALTEEQVSKGAWLEFQVNDIAEVKESLERRGIKPFDYHDKNFDYFCLPGGQVFRLCSAE